MTYMDLSYQNQSLGVLNLEHCVLRFSCHTKHLSELAFCFIPYRWALANEILWGRLYSYLAGLMGKKSLCKQIASL